MKLIDDWRTLQATVTHMCSIDAAMVDRQYMIVMQTQQ